MILVVYPIATGWNLIFFPIGEMDGQLFSINLNLEPGYLMGDPRYADSVCGCAFDRTAIASGHPQ